MAAVESTVEVVEVTPKLAAEWLTLNMKNRNLREVQAQAYAADMTAGDWHWTGETIKFASSGELIDGQHRLRAIVIADITIPMLIVRGLKAEVQEDVDRGIPRKFYDVLHLRGETNAAALAAIVRGVHVWIKSSDGADHGHYYRGRITVTTAAQLSRTLEAHPELRTITTHAKTISGQIPAMSPSTVGLALWIFTQIDEEDARFFFAQLASMEGMFAKDPIYELRQALERLHSNTKGQRSQVYVLAVTIKAWNAYRDGTSVGLLRWQPGGARKEPFPEPR